MKRKLVMQQKTIWPEKANWESQITAQKASAEKREKNLEELRQKGNTRVLKALMEDFMEAV